MTKLSGSFPLGLFVNESNVLDKDKLQGKIDFMLVKVNGVSDWDKKFAEHVDLAYRLGIPCGLAIYITPSDVDPNWPLSDFNRWNEQAVIGRYLDLPRTKRFHFCVLYYHPSRMIEANGKPMDWQWLGQIPVFMAERLQDSWFTKTKDTLPVNRRVLIGCSEDALKLVHDPATRWGTWPFMSVVDAFTLPSTWDTIRSAMNTVDAPAITPVDHRPLWNFDPYPSHNLDGAGGAGLVSYLGTKENFLKWCNFESPVVNPTPEPDPDPEPTPEPEPGDTSQYVGVIDAETKDLIRRGVVALEKLAGVLK